MGSTLRSLVLRYKADLKDFQKGNRRVIDDIKSSKREIVSLDKEMKKAFTPKVDAARAQIKRLNEQFRAGKMDVQKYGTAVDTLKQKIAAMNRVSAITAHEVGALRSRRTRLAGIDKELAGNFRGSMAESMDSIRSRMGGGEGGGGILPVGGGGGAASRFQSLTGIPLKVAGTLGLALGAKKIVKGAMRRIDAVGSGDEESSILRGARLEAAQGGKMMIKEAENLVSDVAALGIGHAASIATGGQSTQFYRAFRDTALEKDRQKRMDEIELTRQGARAPMDEFRDQQKINQLIKDKSGFQVEELARQEVMAGNLVRANKLYAEAVRIEKESLAINEAKAAAAERYQGSLTGAINDGERELRIAQNIARGDTPRQAAMREAGGTPEQILRSRGIDLELDKLNEVKKAARASNGHWFDEEGDAAARIFDRAKADAARVGAFGDQFATPQEVFAKNLKEIQSMLSLGLDPAIAHRAMMQNAQNAAGSEAKLSRFAPAAEVGSRDEMILREGAKAQSKQQKKMDELVAIQKEALEHAKKNGGEIKVNLTEVNI